VDLRLSKGLRKSNLEIALLIWMAKVFLQMKWNVGLRLSKGGRKSNLVEAHNAHLYGQGILQMRWNEGLRKSKGGRKTNLVEAHNAHLYGQSPPPDEME
jgi:hypothetical protein